MSLRRDVQSAFDSITPPMAGMPDRVVQTVLAEHTARRRKERMLFRLRAPLSLVAVLVLIALVVGALVGGRLVHDWNSAHSSVPASNQSEYQSEVAALEARPLNLPQISLNSPCDQGHNTLGFAYGSGPVYGNGGPSFSTAWGTYWQVPFYTAPDVHGPVLIRGQNIQGDASRVLFVGSYVAGPVVGHDPTAKAGDQYQEVVVNTDDPTHRITSSLSPWKNFGSWTITQGLPKSGLGSSCTGFQFDGAGFTETFSG